MARMGSALKELGELRARSSMRLGAKSKHLERPEARDALAIMIASVRNKRHLAGRTVRDQLFSVSRDQGIMVLNG